MERIKDLGVIGVILVLLAAAALLFSLVSCTPNEHRVWGLKMVRDMGWSDAQFTCLDALWTRESGWDAQAMNPSSGAYGIPQSLPGDKMAAAGADWRTNPITQIRWGLDYIQGRYGTPCGAWAHSQAVGWY